MTNEDSTSYIVIQVFQYSFNVLLTFLFLEAVNN